MSPANRRVSARDQYAAELQLGGLGGVDPEDHDGAASSDRVDRALERGGMPDRVDHHVGSPPVGRLGERGHGVPLVDVHGDRARGLGEREPGRLPVERVDGRRRRTPAAPRSCRTRPDRSRAPPRRRSVRRPRATPRRSRSSVRRRRRRPPRRRRASGTRIRLTSASGTRSRSACAPGSAPPKIPYPKIASSSHRADCPLPQNQHCPHATLNATATRSPTCTRSMPAPTDSTTPTASWPSGSPGSIGALPWSRWRSLPQIADLVTRTIASSGASTSGSGRSATRTRPSPSKTTPRIRTRRGTSCPPGRRCTPAPACP